ncbi:MAG TPA: DNA-directed RNA polymerase subunit omega [Terriglobia bacterium]|nr:DNA-directed RNA polymerase subunit omega [Terriglobia bacterium]
MDLPTSIDSKFRYILIAAKRARQLQAGARPMVQSPSRKATKIAQQEVSGGLIPIEIIELKPGNGD